MKAVLLAAAGFGSTIVSLIMVAGSFQIEGAATRYAITVIAAVVALAMFVAAVYIWPQD